MYVERSLYSIQISNILEPNRTQHEHPPACVIAQHYSFATFVSLRSNSRQKEKLGCMLKTLLFHFNIFKLRDYEIA